MADVIRDARHPYTRGLLAALPHPEDYERRPLVPIPGRAGHADAPPDGARSTRAAATRREECRLAVPELVEIGDGRRHACLVDPFAA